MSNHTWKTLKPFIISVFDSLNMLGITAIQSRLGKYETLAFSFVSKNKKYF